MRCATIKFRCEFHCHFEVSPNLAPGGRSSRIEVGYTAIEIVVTTGVVRLVAMETRNERA